MNFTASWDWPQWAMVVLFFLHLAISSAWHGRERLETSGPRKGLPETYSAFSGFTRVAFWVFVLTAGGFFS